MSKRPKGPAPPAAAIAISDIHVKKRLRALQPKVVDEVAGSMRAMGLEQAIVVRPRADNGYWLIVGHHRLARKRRTPSVIARALKLMRRILFGRTSPPVDMWELGKPT